ncbi:MAG: S8 family peptidase [Chloroflexi bacterium]|nr:S8 family peptidase [Chloroflexota bacterium]
MAGICKGPGTHVRQGHVPCLALMAIALMGAGLAPARAGHLHPLLRQAALNVSTALTVSGPAVQQVIVTGTGTGAGASASLAAAIQSQGGVIQADLPLINGKLASVPTRRLAFLAATDSVATVEPDEVVKASLDVVTRSVGANTVWANPGLTGAGVTVAVVDSGIARHPDLRGRIVGWDDLVNGREQPYDDYGHGTHVAGIIAGDGRSSSHPFDTRPQIGMAPDAHLVGVKVLDGLGNGTVSTVIAGIDWCVQNRARYHIRIINLSLGHKPTESYLQDPLCQACENAARQGILVVGAAGNAGALGFQTIDSPADDPSVLTVGSVDAMGTGTVADDRISSYSGRGPSLFDHVVKPDIVAPGNQVISLLAPGSYLPTRYPQLITPPSVYSTHANGRSEYMTLSGTSMAAAVGSGAAALLIQQDPSQGPGMVKARLMVSATKLAHNLRGVLVSGAGYLNVPAAAALPTSVPGLHGEALEDALALSPLLTRLPGSDLIAVGNGTGGFWKRNLIWGSNAFWGDDTAAMNAFWGDDTTAINAFWGDDTFRASNAFWGDDVLVYGAPFVWGDSPIASIGGEITASNAFWGDDAVWSPGITADNAFWGDDPAFTNPNADGPALSASNAFWGDDLISYAVAQLGAATASNAFWGDDSPSS